VISIKIRLPSLSEQQLVSFPDILVNFHLMDNLFLSPAGIRMLSNKPSLNHPVLVAKKCNLSCMIDRFSFNAYRDIYSLFMLYTVIPAGSRSVLRRKIGVSGCYIRDYNESLNNLKWVSAKYVRNEYGQVLFMQSPILLFNSYISNYYVDVREWFSAFVSLLSTGFLEFVVNYFCFCLGSFKLNPSDLVKK